MYHQDYYLNSDTLYFSGYKWVSKDSKEKITGPGQNFFSGSKENVWVDPHGKLHLKTSRKDGRWYCSEVRLTESFGYGEYTFRVEANPAKLDKNFVVGFFTYDHDDSAHHHREIDMEFATWGKDNDLNTQYVVQPASNPENISRFNTDLSRTTEHTISWRKNKIRFKSSYVISQKDTVVLKTYAEWSKKPHRVVRKGQEKFSINIWLYKASFASDFKDYEVVLSQFYFIPYKLEKVKPFLRFPFF